MKRVESASKSTVFCSAFRFAVSAAIDSRKPLGAWTRRHLRRCDSCARFRENCLTLGEALRSEAIAEQPVGGGISAHVVRGPFPIGQRRSVWFTQVAAACVALVASIFWLNGRTQPASEPTRYAFATPDIAVARAWTQMLAAPLAAEAENLSNEAQSGIRFLITCVAVRPAAGSETMQLQEDDPSPLR